MNNFKVGMISLGCPKNQVDGEVMLEKLNKSGRFILLSDLHNKSFGKDNQRLIKAIDKQNPDAILIAGDMYTSAKNENNMASADFVCRLAEKYPVYYGNGNHEHKTRLYPEPCMRIIWQRSG